LLDYFSQSKNGNGTTGAGVPTPAQPKYYNINIDELRDNSLEYSSTTVVMLWQQPSQIFSANL
jgi:hypothetical protein